MNLTIALPDEEVQSLKAKATARGVSAEQYALEVLEQHLAADAQRAAPRPFDNLSDLLLNSPFAGADLNLDRPTDQPRTIDLE
jgi:plasmid stability protein